MLVNILHFTLKIDRGLIIELCQTLKMELFAEIVNDFQLLTIGENLRHRCLTGFSNVL